MTSFRRKKLLEILSKMYLGEGLSANSIRTTTQKYDFKKNIFKPRTK